MANIARLKYLAIIPSFFLAGIFFVFILLFTAFFYTESANAGVTEVDIPYTSTTRVGSWNTGSTCATVDNTYTSTTGDYAYYTVSLVGGTYTWYIWFYQETNRGPADFYIDGNLVNGSFTMNGSVACHYGDAGSIVVSSYSLSAGSHTFKIQHPGEGGPYVNFARFVIERDCAAGQYSSGGSCLSCAAGYYGSATTNTTSSCDGVCNTGIYCPAGSTTVTGSGSCTAGS